VQIRRTHLLFIVLAFSACTAHEARPVVVPLQPVVIPLQYEAGLVKADFPNPVVRLTFNRRTAWFVVDTGAGVHTLAQWFTDSDGMKIHDSLTGAVRAVDSTGESVAFRAVRDQVGRLRDRTALVFKVSMVAAFPPEFEAAGVGGLVNPQLLADRGQAATLDLRVPELRFEAFEEAVRRLGAQILPSDQMRICGTADAAVPNLLFAVLAKTSQGEGWLQLDSGAAATTLTSESSLASGLELETGGETVGVGGKRRSSSRARSLTISFAGHRTSVDAQVVETTGGTCGPDGMLGLDVMSRCAFVFGKGSLALACSS
jgi:hypothetical protein